MIEKSSALSSSGSSRWFCSVIRSPCTRMRGGSPAMTCRSEPLRICMLFRNSLISDMVLTHAHAARQHGRVGDESLEPFAIDREPVRVVGVDLLGLDRVQQRLIHQLHADVLTRLQIRRDLVRLL